MMERSNGVSQTHPLLQELRGILALLKSTNREVADGDYHLVPLCETLERVLRTGLKQPNSLFGLNKQDYWSWIEPLQDYYFNQKQNPLLRQLVSQIANSPKLHTPQGRGRCFIRRALCQKLISVPIEHLAANKRLTSYWYGTDHSIVGDPLLIKELMSILFEVTEIDFQLDVNHCSFLDETWIIPVYMSVSLQPVRELGVKVGHTDHRVLITEVDKDSMAYQAGIQPGYMLDELCGETVYNFAGGKLKHILERNAESTDIVVVKQNLPDGCPFHPILRRQQLAANQTSPISPTTESSAEYTAVCLSYEWSVDEVLSEEAFNTTVSHALTSCGLPRVLLVKVTPLEVSILTEDREVLKTFPYKRLAACGRGSAHHTCFALVERYQQKKATVIKAYVFETSTSEMATAICQHIAQGFNQSEPNS